MAILDTLIAIGIALVAFAVLLAFIVFIHEYGHFKMARICGIRVDTFSIGFGPAFVQWTDRKGTVWKIASIPLGGYVKFFGDANAASAGTSTADEDEEGGKPLTTQFGSEKDRLAALLTEEEKKVCFHFKPIWQRMLVVAAGPISNFVLGAIIFGAMLIAVGTREVPPVVGYVQPDSAAQVAGFEPGDRVLSINRQEITEFDEMATRVSLASDEQLTFTVDRDGRVVTLTAVPRRTDRVDAFGNDVRFGQLGIEAYRPPVIGAIGEDVPASDAGLQLNDRIVSIAGAEVYTWSDIGRALDGRIGETVPISVERDGRRIDSQILIEEGRYEFEDGTVQTFPFLGVNPEPHPIRRMGPAEAAYGGVLQVGDVLSSTMRFLGRLVTGKEDPRQLGGPVKIGQYAGQAAMAGFQYDTGLGQQLLISLQYFMNLAALISVSIGFMNLLPIPVLDGGHLLYYAYEAVAGRPLSDRVQQIGFQLGLVLVGTFFIFVTVNNVVDLF